MEKVNIIWRGMGGELDSAQAKDDGDGAIRDALIAMLRNQIVSPGDSITVELAD